MIFNIFKSNKKILLFLFEKEIITPNQTIANVLTSKKYKEQNYIYYFYPEVEPYIQKKETNNKKKEPFYFGYNHNEEKKPKNFGQYYYEDKDSFMTKRKVGENDEYICNLIRNDLIIDFITYVNKTNKPFNSQIPSSIYETNEFLITNNPTLIEYAAFFGSIQIFNFLFKNNVELTQSLWIYAIHGNHPEIIHFLEENKVHPKEYNDCFNEAIKCHHNNIADYIKNNYLENEMEEEDNEEEDKKEEEDLGNSEMKLWKFFNEKDKEEEDDEDDIFGNSKMSLFKIKDEKENEVEEKEQKLFDAIRSFSNPIIKYFNYAFFNTNMLNDSMIYNICKYDYPSFFSIINMRYKLNIKMIHILDYIIT